MLAWRFAPLAGSPAPAHQSSRPRERMPAAAFGLGRALPMVPWARAAGE